MGAARIASVLPKSAAHRHKSTLLEALGQKGHVVNPLESTRQLCASFVQRCLQHEKLAEFCVVVCC